MKMHRKIYCPQLLIVVLSVISQAVFGQADKFIPATPDAMAMSKSINFQVGYNTGVPNISIPLHEIKVGGMTLPIAISYHAGGFKINEQSGDVGLGWSLSTNLEITRKVNGMDDFLGGGNEHSGYYLNGDFEYRKSLYPVSGFQLANYYFSLASNTDDEQPDEFSYKLLGKSGSFFFRKDAYGNIYTESVPHEDIEIKYEPGSPGTFKITDGDGTVYLFSSFESSYSGATRYYTTWKCDRIINPSNTDFISFLYEPESSKFLNTSQDRIEIFDQSSLDAANPDIIDKAFIDDYFGSVPRADVLLESLAFHKISCPKAISYSSGNDRGLHLYGFVLGENDMREEGETAFYEGNDLYPSPETMSTINGLFLRGIGFRGGSVQFSANNGHLTSIDIMDNNNTIPFKTIEFRQSSIGNATSEITWYLDSIKINSNNNGGETYGFNYNKAALQRNVKGSDAWGGINTSTMPLSQPIAVPTQTVHTSYYDSEPIVGVGFVPDFPITIGRGSLNPAYYMWGLLTKITYPTGGYAKFDFGQNYYMDLTVNQARPAGGIRVNKIEYYDGKNLISPAFKKIYKYGRNENGYGKIKYSSNLKSLLDSTCHYTQTRYYLQENNIYTYPTYEILATERVRTFMSTPAADLFYSGGAPVQYDYITEYQEENGTLTGKTVYTYSDPCGGDDEVAYINGLGNNFTARSNDWRLSVLESETYYKYEANAFDTVMQKKYTYHDKDVCERAPIKVGLIFQNTIGKALGTSSNEGYPGVYTPYDFNYVTYSLEVGKLLLKNVEEIWKHGGKKTTQNTTYYYNINNYPASIIKTLSGGEMQRESITYPSDYSSGTSFISAMKSKHMNSYPVEKTTIVSGKVVSGEIYHYQSNGLVDTTFQLEAPDPITDFEYSNNITNSTFRKDLRYKEKVNLTYDNYANPVMEKPNGHPSNAYYWGYQNYYPVIKAENLDNQTLSLYVNQSLLQTGYTTLDGLLYSMFQNSDASWKTFNENLRSKANNVMFTTYTYIPFVGISSMTDPKGVTTYYEYDSFKRLNKIKDKEMKTKKQFDYHYINE